MPAGPLVGIDIGSQQIKLVEMRPAKTGLVVSALGLGPTPPGIIQNNIITDPAAMGLAVKQLMKDSGITAKRAVGCLSGQNAVVIRIIEVPRMTDSELKETMKWEVERHVPFAPSETVLDYQPLAPLTPEAASGPNMEVLLAVAQQDAVNSYLDTLFAAGLDPIALDIEPLALSRALLDLQNGQPLTHPQRPIGEQAFLGGGLPSETVAIVNIGAANTDIAIFQGDQLAFPRSLPLAGDSLTRAIAEALQYPAEQAERIKREFGLVQLDRMAVYTGTGFGEEEADYEAPQFQDEDAFGAADTLSMPNPFGTEAEVDASSPFQTTPSGRLGGEPQFDDLERTQPMSRRTLNLARPAASDVPPAFLPPDDDLGFGLPGAGGPGDEQMRNDIFEAIAPVLGELASEIRRSLDYFRSRGASAVIDRVLLTGGTANLTNLAAFLQNELQAPVAVAAPLSGLSVTSKHFDPSYLPTIGSAFTVALGLSAREAVFAANPVPKAPKPPKTPKAAKAAS